MVRSLLTTFQHEYEQDAETPQKSNQRYEKSYFLESEKIPFPKDCTSSMKKIVNNVPKKARRAKFDRAYEKQWGALVNELLIQVEIWQEPEEEIFVLNVYELYAYSLPSGLLIRAVQ